MRGGVVDLFGGPDDTTGIDPDDLVEGYETELRWRRQTSQPWPVASHASVVASVLRRMGAVPIVQLAGLLHDIEEPIVGDVPGPLRRLLTVDTPNGMVRFDRFSQSLRHRCIVALGVPVPAVVAQLTTTGAVQHADAIVLHAETLVIAPASANASTLARVPVSLRDLVPHAAAAIRARLPVQRGEFRAHLDTLCEAVRKHAD